MYFLASTKKYTLLYVCVNAYYRMSYTYLDFTDNLAEWPTRREECDDSKYQVDHSGQQSVVAQSHQEISGLKEESKI